MWCIKNMAALVFVLYELFPLDGFSCYFVSAPKYQSKLDCMIDIMQISRTGHDINLTIEHAKLNAVGKHC